VRIGTGTDSDRTLAGLLGGIVIAGLTVQDVPALSIGHVDLIGFVLIFPMSAMTAPVGARLAHALNRIWLRRAFALFLGVTSMHMLIRFSG